ncbi:MAG: AmmeMemoRadiSam system protein B [Rhodospirillales bacterium]|nr:AmmeMemoRadiSam system protein B [Rhodospirillales bacterium]
MTAIRAAAVAGQFYPGSAAELTATIERHMDEAKTSSGPVPKAIIAPHAGYVYSGSVAASAYARVRPAAERITRVVLLGPCHRVPVRGLALSSAEAFSTPLGNVTIDRDAGQLLLDLPQVQIFDATHDLEHSLEVHVPFLQVILGDFKLLPLVVGEATLDEVAQVLEAVWGGPETLIVVSSDLSHYENYETARRMDESTCRAIEQLDPASIGRYDACGRVPVGGLLRQAQLRGLNVSTVDLRNSGDTAGSRDKVVGYGSWVFVEPGEKTATGTNDGADANEQPEKNRDDHDVFAERTRQILADHKQTLLHVAAASIENGLGNSRPLAVDPSDYAEILRENGASFVTLKRDGKLRGCIGTSVATQPLIRDVAEHGYAAAFRDPRFPALAAQEIPDLILSVSVLSASSPMTFADQADLHSQLRRGIDGLIIEDAGRKALFLPSVWETLPDVETFVGHLKIKAGLSADHWTSGFKAWRFVAEEASVNDLPDPGSVWSANRVS